MTIEVNLTTTEEILEGVSHLVDTRKQVVRIERQTLSNLLLDYDRMRQALRGSQFKVNTPAPRRERVKL